MSLFSRNPKENQEKDSVLLEATARLKEALGTSGSLSEGARERILSRGAMTPAVRETGLRPLFVPAFKLAAAVCVPVALAAGVSTLVLLNRSGGEGSSGALEVHKVGDQVVFTIANGSKVHYVYRSTDPGRFDPGSGVRVEDGRFQDRAANGPGIIFYRIE